MNNLWLTSLVFAGVIITSTVYPQDNQVIVSPPDNGAELCNPDMGWVHHHYDNVPGNYGSRLEPSDTIDEYPGFTTVYLRIPWSWIEPEEGVFNWSTLDTPAQRWIDKGKRIALRISCSESWTRFATPQWVKDAGANGFEFEPGKGITETGPFWEPDYDDPIFMEKLENFIAALAKRYDGNPEVAFVDVGSFGVWGEGHTYASSLLPFSADTIKRHIDLYKKHFKNTLLVANDDFGSQGRDKSIIDYAREQGLSLRDDSILVQAPPNMYFNAAMAEGIWQNVPVILESEHYGGSRDRGCWGDGHWYLQAVEDYHASYCSIHWWPYEFLAEQRELIRQMNMRMGYRLQLREATWPARLKMDNTIEITMRWRNAGVAPCYPGGYPAITLKDTKNGIAAVFVLRDLDIKTLPVGAPDAAEEREARASFHLPWNMQSGEFDVFVSVGTLTGTPVFELPLDGNDGYHRYPLGKLVIGGDYSTSTGELVQNGNVWTLPVTWNIYEKLPAETIPFMHFEENGQIIFMGYPADTATAARLPEVGNWQSDFQFEIPASAAGRKFDVLFGLFNPTRIGQDDERIWPDRNDNNRRTSAGTLSVAEDGTPTLQK